MWSVGNSGCECSVKHVHNKQQVRRGNSQTKLVIFSIQFSSSNIIIIKISIYNTSLSLDIPLVVVVVVMGFLYGVCFAFNLMLMLLNGQIVYYYGRL